MDVSIIIVTYNSASCIQACLASVTAQQGIEVEIIVVDNASADETVDVVKAAGVRVIANQENVGFGRANNQGFAASSGRFVYLLNPDSQLVERDGLARLCRALQEHESWGMAGTCIYSPDGQAEVTPVTYPGHRFSRRDFSKLPGRIAWVMGASMIVRRQIFSALDGFDPGFFLYSEETDFCLRLRELGHEIGFVSDVAVRHIGGASEHGRDPYEVWKRKMSGMHRFWKKHYAAEEAARLVRRDKYRASFRMFWHGLCARFQPRPSNAWRKHRQYLAIWESSREFIEAN